MKAYFRHLWTALCGRIHPRIAALEARVEKAEAGARDSYAQLRAAAETRSAAGRKAHETRKAKAKGAAS